MVGLNEESDAIRDGVFLAKRMAVEKCQALDKDVWNTIRFGGVLVLYAPFFEGPLCAGESGTLLCG